MADFVICPFWKWRKNKVISCESGQMKFNNTQDALDFIHSNCCKWNYEECPRAKELLKKYETQNDFKERV